MRRALAASITATLATRLLAASIVRVEPAWDGFFYARYAQSIASGSGYSVADGAGVRATAFYPVGYPAAMAAVLRVTHDARIAAVTVNLLASLLAVSAVVWVAHRAAGARAATLAGLSYAFYPGAVLWSAAAMTETLTGALLAVAMALTLSSQRVGAGLALGLATLVRPQSLLLLPLTGLSATTWRGRALAVALAAMSACVVVLPWTARNCQRLDACALVSTNGGSNLLIGTFPDARGGYRRPTVSDGCASERGEVRRDRCMSAAATARIREAPLRWASLGALKVAVTFLWEHDPVSYALGDTARARPVARLSGAALLTLAWWALAGFAWRATTTRHTALIRWTLGAFTVAVITHAAFLGADRYHLLLVPLLCPAAAIGAVTWLDARRRDP